MASSRLTRSVGRTLSLARSRGISSTVVGPVNNGTRARSSTALFLRRRRAAGSGDLVRLDLAGVEAPRAADHLVDRLVEIRGRLALEAQRVDASDDERLEIRTLESTRLHAFYRFVDQLVQLEQFGGALAPRLERAGQFGGEELVAPLEDRVIHAAGEAPVLLVAEAERDERCLLELDLELALRAIVERCEILRQPRHLEGSLAEIVRLLGVQQENSVRDFRFWHDQGDDGLRTQLAHRAEAMVAVRRPVRVLAGGHGDDRVEIPIEL